MKVTLNDSSGREVEVSISSDISVLNENREWVNITAAKYVTMVGLVVTASLPDVKLDASNTSTFSIESFFVLKVLRLQPEVPEITDSNVVSKPDPAFGQCICLVTCKGTNLSYVKVTSL